MGHVRAIAGQITSRTGDFLRECFVLTCAAVALTSRPSLSISASGVDAELEMLTRPSAVVVAEVTLSGRFGVRVGVASAPSDDEGIERLRLKGSASPSASEGPAGELICFGPNCAQSCLCAGARARSHYGSQERSKGDAYSDDSETPVVGCHRAGHDQENRPWSTTGCSKLGRFFFFL